MRGAPLGLAVCVVVGLAAMACAAPGSPSPTPTTAELRITLTDVTFPSYTCREAGHDPCRGLADSVAEAKASSRQAGAGTFRSTLVVDDSDPGPNGDCNTVDENDTFTFTTGTITLRSLHRDCNFAGPRVETLFAVTGGTGQFAGATGFGTETDDDGFIYDGTITYAGTAPKPS